MAIRFTCPAGIRKVVDKGSSRGLSSAVAVPVVGSKDGAFVVATNAKMLGVAETIDAKLDGPTRLPFEAQVKNGKPGAVALDGKTWQTAEGKTTRLSADDSGSFWYPDAPACIPAIEAGRVYTRVTLDASMLAQLATMLNSGTDNAGVTLFLTADDSEAGEVNGAMIQDHTKAIPVVGSTGIGVIMPLSGGDDAAARYAEKRDQFANAFNRDQLIAAYAEKN